MSGKSVIAELYSQVMAGEEAEKVASAATDVADDGGPEFDRAFFEKVASGDEEAVAVINQFIEESRAEGHSDEEIEGAIAEALQAAGVEDEPEATETETETAAAAEIEEDEDDVEKAAAYIAGAEKALEDVLESDLAKEAGVTLEEIEEYMLGGFYGSGYAEARRELDEVVEKIAAHKKEAGKVGDAARAVGGKAKELAGKLMSKAKGAGATAADKVKAGGNRAKELLTGSNLGATGLGTATPAGKAEARKVLGARVAAGTLGVGTAGAGALALKSRKKKD